MTQEERTYIINLLKEQKLSFEKDYYKSLLFLSSGALALSISIVQVFINSTYVSRNLIIISWFSFIVAVAAILIYFILAPFEMDKRIKEIKMNENTLQKIDDDIDKITEAIADNFEGKKVSAYWKFYKESIQRKVFKFLGYLSTLAFIVGMVSLLLFTIHNVTFVNGVKAPTKKEISKSINANHTKSIKKSTEIDSMRNN